MNYSMAFFQGKNQIKSCLREEGTKKSPFFPNKVWSIMQPAPDRMHQVEVDGSLFQCFGHKGLIHFSSYYSVGITLEIRLGKVFYLVSY